MTRLLTFALALTVLAAGCAPRSSAARNTMMVGGTVILASGLLMFAAMDEGDDTDGDGVDEFPDGDIACMFGGCMAAALLSVAGTGLLVGGLVTPVETVAEPAPIGPTAPTVNGPPGTPLALQRPLPELEVDGQTLRLAKQVRSAVLRLDCTAARQTLGEIEVRDRSYHLALLASPVLDGCR